MRGMLSYGRFLAEGALLVRGSHDRARQAGSDEDVATWRWRHGRRPHLDGNSFLVSVGNVRHIQREERQAPALSDSSDDDEDEDTSLQPLDEASECIAEEDACVVAPLAPTPTAANALETSEPVLLELHIVFHATYQTPALYFRASTVDGTPVNSERVLRSVHFAGRGHHAPVVASMELHPVLGTPFSLLHPCETAAAMELLLGQAEDAESSTSSKDGADGVPTYLASWLSLVQPLTGISPMDYYAVG